MEAVICNLEWWGVTYYWVRQEPWRQKSLGWFVRQASLHLMSQPNTFRPFFSHLILQPKPLIHHTPSHVSNSTNAKKRKINNLGSIAILIKPCDQNIEESSSEIQSARILQHFEIWSPGIRWTFERKSCSEIWHVFIASMTYIWPE